VVKRNVIVFAHIVFITLIIYASINMYFAFAKGTALKKLEQAKSRMPFFFKGPLNNRNFYNISYKIGGVMIILMLLLLEYMLITRGIPNN
jgi:hypothetical protein